MTRDELQAELARATPVVNGNAPVFPHVEAAADVESYRGLTKREEFAARAMQGLLANEYFHGEVGNRAKMAVEAADALLVELSRAK